MTAHQDQVKSRLLMDARLTILHLKVKSFEQRRSGIIFIAVLLGHDMRPVDVIEQPWGAVCECPNCGQVAKTPREGDAIEGRATTTMCPAFQIPERPTP
jgi:hypothetical protein